MKKLSINEISRFINDGFVKVENAFPIDLADECRDILWKATGCERNNPDTWRQPVIRIGELGLEPFKKAANTHILHRAFDQLVGKNNWIPRMTLGSFPIRFPSEVPAADTGWHVDASFPGPKNADNYLHWRINLQSKGRALLMLFLFSDVSNEDAPTVIRIGSHLNVAKLLERAREYGLSFLELAQKLASVPSRDEALATGNAGTVYLCHPFIVHAAQDHHGKNPKFMAQPPLQPKMDFNINRPENELCPVEKAILKGLGK
ncbi:MAG TPA: hypothetical protein VKA49_12125 [Flavitalea sp.]|nr:hypothetical protein [Flavitalea sp.]